MNRIFELLKVVVDAEDPGGKLPSLEVSIARDAGCGSAGSPVSKHDLYYADLRWSEQARMAVEILTKTHASGPSKTPDEAIQSLYEGLVRAIKEHADESSAKHAKMLAVLTRHEGATGA